jgi:hypothetical protein
MIPHFVLGFVEKGFHGGVVAVYLCLSKTKNICLNGFHVYEGVRNVGVVVGELQAINGLEINTDDLCLPGFGDILGGKRMGLENLFAYVVGGYWILEADA